MSSLSATVDPTQAAPPPTVDVIEGAYLHDILEQPAALRALAETLRTLRLPATVAAGLRTGRFERAVLTGMGSSCHALYPAHLRLIEHGVASYHVETSELLLGFDALRTKETLLIAVSQSGESAEIVHLMNRAADYGHVIGVTNSPASTLARSCDTTLPLSAGAEATVSCKTYLATLAALRWLSMALCGEDVSRFAGELEQAAERVAEYLSRWRHHVAELADVVRGVTSVYVTGRGPSLATAGTAGLTLKESTRRPSEGMTGPAFRHGPLEAADATALVLIMAGDDRVARPNQRLADDINARGGRAVMVARGDDGGVFALPAIADALLPVAEILPVQMLSLAIAARDGREAGLFEKASKITTAE